MQAKTATEKFMAPSQDQKKHTLPFVFMLIGGFLILLGGLTLLGVVYGFLVHPASANAIISNFIAKNPSIAHNTTDLKLIDSYVNNGTYETLYIVVAAVGIICGIMVMLSGIMSYNPKGNRLKIFSIVAIIFSLVSILGNAGFIVGMILGIIGGVLGLMKK